MNKAWLNPPNQALPGKFLSGKAEEERHAIAMWGTDG